MLPISFDSLAVTEYNFYVILPGASSISLGYHSSITAKHEALPSCHFTFICLPRALILSLKKPLSISLMHFVLCIPICHLFFSNVVCFIGQSLVFLLSSFLLQIFVGSLMPILDWTFLAAQAVWQCSPIQLGNWWKSWAALPSHLQLHRFYPLFGRVWPWDSFRCSKANYPCKMWTKLSAVLVHCFTATQGKDVTTWQEESPELEIQPSMACTNHSNGPVSIPSHLFPSLCAFLMGFTSHHGWWWDNKSWDRK